MCKISLRDTVYSAIDKISDNNDKAKEILRECIRIYKNVDPASLYKDFTLLINCDAYGVYGDRLVRLFQNSCSSNYKHFIGVMRAVQLKIISREELNTMIDGNSENVYFCLPFDTLQQRVPAFSAI